MMNTIHLTKQQLRTFLMNYQGLSDPSEFEGKDGIIKLFDRIETIQFDPLNIIGKNADLVLQARIPNYKEKILTEMLYEDRTLIDGWDKMMSIYLTKDFSNFHRIRDVKEREIKNMLRHRNHLEALDFKDDVLNFIKENGPTYPKDIKLGNVSKSVWGHGKISSVVSDYLWNIGLIG